MSQVQTIEAGGEVSMSPVMIVPVGAKLALRQESVMVNAHTATVTAFADAKGSLGKMARAGLAGAGRVNIAALAANANYRPMAEWLALKLDTPVLVRNRAEYVTMPTILDVELLKAEAKGTAAGEKKAEKLRGIRAELVDMMAEAEAIFAKRKAERAERAAELAQDVAIAE